MFTVSSLTLLLWNIYFAIWVIPLSDHGRKLLALLGGTAFVIAAWWWGIVHTRDSEPMVAEMTRKQLQSAVKRCADELRALEHNSKSQRLAGLLTPASFDQRAHDLAKSHEDAHVIFAPIRSRAMVLRDELLDRHRKDPPKIGPEMQASLRVVFDFGMMSGVSPLADTATYLENLAATLPDDPRSAHRP